MSFGTRESGVFENTVCHPHFSPRARNVSETTTFETFFQQDARNKPIPSLYIFTWKEKRSQGLAHRSIYDDIKVFVFFTYQMWQFFTHNFFSLRGKKKGRCFFFCLRPTNLSTSWERSCIQYLERQMQPSLFSLKKSVLEINSLNWPLSRSPKGFPDYNFPICFDSYLKGHVQS